MEDDHRAEGTVVRTWPTTIAGKDIQISADLRTGPYSYVRFIVRGDRLDSATPSYYGVLVDRYLRWPVLRVENGAEQTVGADARKWFGSDKTVRVTLCVDGDTLRVRYYDPQTRKYLDASTRGNWVETPVWATTQGIKPLSGTLVGIERPYQNRGKTHIDNLVVRTPPDCGGPSTSGDGGPPTGPVANRSQEATPPEWPATAPNPLNPRFPRMLPNVRVYICFGYQPQTGFARDVARKVDFALVTKQDRAFFRSARPDLPIGIYSNCTNIYGELLTGWFKWADTHGLSREGAFYHAAAPSRFRGDSPSSLPVTRFWGLFLGDSRPARNLERAIWPSGEGFSPPGLAGHSFSVGYPDPYREINVRLSSAPAGRWAGLWEYPTAENADGTPGGWRRLPLLADSTRGLRQDGRILFDPPAGWKAAQIGSSYLFYLRCRTASAGRPPVVGGLKGRDFVAARGSNTAIIPVFDDAADANGDGYLNEDEYASRANGKDARFSYESRMLTPTYGQMRFTTNPGDPSFRRWVVAYHRQMYGEQVARIGAPNVLFLDNNTGRFPLRSWTVAEPGAGTYARDLGTLDRALSDAIRPGFVLPHAGPLGLEDAPILQRVPLSWNEKEIQPLRWYWKQYLERIQVVKRLAALTDPQPYIFHDSYTAVKGPADVDERFRIGALVCFLQMRRDPTREFFSYLGYSYDKDIRYKWADILAYDFGAPLEEVTTFAEGPDPENGANFKIFRRPYDGPDHDGRADILTLFKPVSFTDWAGVKSHPSSISDATATTHDLGGAYRPLRSDGRLSPTITRITLRNGEGAILVKQQTPEGK